MGGGAVAHYFIFSFALLGLSSRPLLPFSSLKMAHVVDTLDAPSSCEWFSSYNLFAFHIG